MLAEHSSWAGEQIEVLDTKLYVERHGHGEPLVCLHNFSGNSRARFGPILPQLSAHFECFLVDLRGHGRSEIGTAPWTHHQGALDIIALCKALQLRSAYFFAVSSGAMIMLRVAQYRPRLVRAMVLDSTTNEVPESSRRYYRYPPMLSPKLKAMYREANEIYGPEFGPVLAKIFHDFRLAESDVNQPISGIQKIKQPTLLIHGDRDLFFPVQIPYALHKAMRKSELYVAEDTGHIVLEAHPELVANLAISFLEEVASHGK